MLIAQYWDSGAPPDDVSAQLATFRELNPDLSHRVFDEERAARLIADRFGKRELAAFRACAVPSMRADYFRYCAILAFGGVYADVSFGCRAPLRSMLARFDDGLLFRREPPGYVLNGFFAFSRPGHPLLRLALEIATENIERRACELVQMVTGPWIFSGLAALDRLASTAGHRQAVAERGLDCLEAPLRREAVARALTPGAREGVERMVEPLIESVGELGRLERAFDGVQVASYEAMGAWIGETEPPPAYKRSDSYWVNWQRRNSIFR